MAHEANAILAISSTDRYIKSSGGNVNQPVSDTVIAQWRGGFPTSSDFSIESPNALMNGYIDRIIISQIQLQYNLPTIIPGRNDILLINIENPAGSGTYIPLKILIPYGYYTPDELSAVTAAIINKTAELVIPNWTASKFIIVSYNQGATPGSIRQTLNFSAVGYVIQSNDPTIRIYFPAPTIEVPGLTPDEFIIVYKTYKLFGFTLLNTLPDFLQVSQSQPTFLYTPFIDIYSDALTNYQKLKDTDSSTSKRKGLISRLYLSGVGQPQLTTTVGTQSLLNFTYMEEAGEGRIESTSSIALGSYPFVITFDLNSPKVVNWTPDSAINSLDFQMRDCYGDLLFSSADPVGLYNGETFNTEFQMTLLCIES
jgi:hypothetical protein